jgi:hypothetical protein
MYYNQEKFWSNYLDRKLLLYFKINAEFKLFVHNLISVKTETKLKEQ